MGAVGLPLVWHRDAMLDHHRVLKSKSVSVLINKEGPQPLHHWLDSAKLVNICSYQFNSIAVLTLHTTTSLVEKKAIGGTLFWLMRGAYGMRHHCHITSNNLSVAHFNMRHA
jgi:hypothetical protein